MPARPSEPLLVFLREAIRRKGLSTAELAERVGRTRSEVKRALSGAEALTVDDLVLLSQALQLTPAELGLVGPGVEVPEEPPAPGLRVATAGEAPPDEPPGADPFGNVPRQVLELGFELGVDLLVDCEAAALGDSGVPKSTLAASPKVLRLTFPARYHKHNRPRFEDEAFGCRLSFDRIYDCAIPWEAMRVVSFLLPEEAPPAPAPDPTPQRPGLRIVK